jgi:transposase
VTAAILIGHTAGAQRFPTDGHFARLAGVAPIPVSSGRRHRHRLHRGGDRQLNKALHIIAITPDTRAPRGRPRLQGAVAMPVDHLSSGRESAAVKGCCNLGSAVERRAIAT